MIRTFEPGLKKITYLTENKKCVSYKESIITNMFFYVETTTIRWYGIENVINVGKSLLLTAYLALQIEFKIGLKVGMGHLFNPIWPGGGAERAPRHKILLFSMKTSFKHHKIS